MKPVFGLLAVGFGIAFGVIPTMRPLQICVAVLVAVLFTVLWLIAPQIEQDEANADAPGDPDTAAPVAETVSATRHRVPDLTKRPGDTDDGYEA